MNLQQLVAFFWAVLRPTRAFLGCLVLIAAYGGQVAVTNPARFSELFAIALIAQTFGASTGFWPFATRGCLDPVLVAGHRRTAVAMTHCLVSVAPGFALLVVLVGVDIAANGLAAVASITGTVLVAFIWVSMLAWAAGLPLRRYTAGLTWLLVMFVVLAAADVPALREHVSTRAGTWSQFALAALTGAVCPVFLIAEAARVPAAVLVALSAMAVVAGSAGMRLVYRADVPLSE